MRRTIAAVCLATACGGGDGEPGGGADAAAPELDARTPAFLAPPPEGEGFQVELAPFDIAPGEEVYYCYRLPLPAGADFDLQRLESRFSLGAHHMLVSTIEKDYEPGHGRCTANEFGYEVDLIEAFSSNLRFLSGAQTPYSDDPRAELALEPGLAFRVRTGSSLLVQLHWVNTTDSVQRARTAINVWYAASPPSKLLDAFFFYHTAIELPPHEDAEVAGRCTFPQDVEVVGMVSHMHARGTGFTTHRYDGSLGDMLYEESSWQDPVMKMWPMAGLLQVGAGTGVEYRCLFRNDTDDWIYEGDGAGEEMCMLIGLYTGGAGGTLWGFPGAGFAGNACVDTP